MLRLLDRGIAAMATALRASAAAAAIIYAGLMSSLQASPTCPDKQPTAQFPQDLQFCQNLEGVVRNPGGMRLDKYEALLGAYLGAFCHRNVEGYERAISLLQTPTAVAA